MTRIHRLALTILAATALSAPAAAAVIVDQSPGATGFAMDFSASNQIGAQNFFVQFTLANAATITTMDIYTNSGVTVSLGAGVVVRFRADAGNAPDAINLASFATTLSAIDGVGVGNAPDAVRLSANFAGIALNAGTYWASLAGVSEIGWYLGQGTPYPTWQFQGENAQFFRDWYAPFRLSDGAAVPEPAAWALMIAGFGLVGGAVRTRKRGVAFA